MGATETRKIVAKQVAIPGIVMGVLTMVPHVSIRAELQKSSPDFEMIDNIAAFGIFIGSAMIMLAAVLLVARNKTSFKFFPRYGILHISVPLLINGLVLVGTCAGIVTQPNTPKGIEQKKLISQYTSIATVVMGVMGGLSLFILPTHKDTIALKIGGKKKRASGRKPKFGRKYPQGWSQYALIN